MTVEAADVSSRTFFNYSATKDEALIGDPITDGPDFQDALLAQPSDRSVVKAIRRALAPTIDDIQNHRELWRLRMRVTKANPWLLPALFVCGAAVEFVAAIAKRTGHPADSAFTELTATSVEATVAEDAVAPAGAPLAAEAVDASVSAIATEAAAEAGAAEPSAAAIVEARAPSRRNQRKPLLRRARPRPRAAQLRARRKRARPRNGAKSRARPRFEQSPRRRAQLTAYPEEAGAGAAGCRGPRFCRRCPG